MILFPAIDLKDGKCVRLLQGDFEKKTVFSDNPVEVAVDFEKKGAKYIHLVDLDGALNGKLVNGEIIKDIINSVNIPVELGGGVRSLENIEALLKLGVSRVIVGTMAIKNPALLKEAIEKYGPEKIVVGIDAKNGKVAIRGWTEVTQKDSLELIKDMKNIGVETIIYTDIAKDGMLSGVNIDYVKEILNNVDIKVVISGGISSEHDLFKIRELKNTKIESAITGKAIYENRIDLEKSIKIMEGEDLWVK